MANARKNKDFNPNNCPVTHVLNRIGGKWKPLIIYAISKNYNRLSLLQKALPVVSKQMLVNSLHELEEDNIVEKISYAEMPPRVEYKLTEYGLSMMSILQVIQDWGSNDLKRLEK